MDEMIANGELYYSRGTARGIIYLRCLSLSYAHALR